MKPLHESYCDIGKLLVDVITKNPHSVWIQDWHTEPCKLADAIKRHAISVTTFKLHGPPRQQLRCLDHLEFLVTQESNVISLSPIADRCRQAGQSDYGCKHLEFAREDNGQLESQVADES